MHDPRQRASARKRISHGNDHEPLSNPSGARDRIICKGERMAQLAMTATLSRNHVVACLCMIHVRRKRGLAFEPSAAD